MLISRGRKRKEGEEGKVKVGGTGGRREKESKREKRKSRRKEAGGEEVRREVREGRKGG